MLANEYIEVCLQRLIKSQLIAMFLSKIRQTKATIKYLRDEVKTMNTNFKKLEALLMLKQSTIF